MNRVRPAGAAPEALRPSGSDTSATLQPSDLLLAFTASFELPASPGAWAEVFAAGGLVGVDVDLAAHVHELPAHLVHALLRFDHGGGARVGLGGVVAHVLRDLHRAEFRPAHRTEVRDLVRVLRQRLVVHTSRAVSGSRPRLNWSSQRKSKRARDSASSRNCAAGWPLARSAACAAILYVMTPTFTSSRLGKPEVLLRRHVAEHRAAEPADHGRADAAGDVVVARRDVGR